MRSRPWSPESQQCRGISAPYSDINLFLDSVFSMSRTCTHTHRLGDGSRLQRVTCVSAKWGDSEGAQGDAIICVRLHESPRTVPASGDNATWVLGLRVWQCAQLFASCFRRRVSILVPQIEMWAVNEPARNSGVEAGQQKHQLECQNSLCRRW